MVIPAPGTFNPDKNPARIASRQLLDLGIGMDDIFRGDRYKLTAKLTVTNLTNEETLYNFLSTFSGTHFVPPRAFTAELGPTLLALLFFDFFPNRSRVGFRGRCEWTQPATQRIISVGAVLRSR